MVRLIFLIALLTSCSTMDRANRHLKKAQRHIDRAVELGAKIKVDTVFTDRPIFIPEHVTDTVIKVKNFTDTIRIENERVAWKVKINTVEKEVFVEAKCKADTVTVEVPVTIHKEIKSGYSQWDLIILAIVVFVLGILLSPLVKKLFK